MANSEFKPLTISISENAAKHVKEFASKEGKETPNLRVVVKGGGCSGLTYVLDIVDGPKENDKVIKDQGMELYIDKKYFISHTILAKHDENYMPPEVIKTLND